MEHYPHSLQLDLALIAFRKALADQFPDCDKSILLSLDTQVDKLIKTTAILVSDGPPKAEALTYSLNKLNEATEILNKEGLNALRRPNAYNHNNLIELAHHWSWRYGALR